MGYHPAFSSWAPFRPTPQTIAGDLIASAFPICGVPTGLFDARAFSASPRLDASVRESLLSWVPSRFPRLAAAPGACISCFPLSTAERQPEVAVSTLPRTGNAARLRPDPEGDWARQLSARG